MDNSNLKKLALYEFVSENGLYAKGGPADEFSEITVKKFQAAFSEYFHSFSVFLQEIFQHKLTLDDMVKSEVVAKIRKFENHEFLNINMYIYSLSFIENRFPGFLRRMDQNEYVVWVATALICGGKCFANSSFGSLGKMEVKVDTINLLTQMPDFVHIEPYLKKMYRNSLKNQNFRGWIKENYVIFSRPYLMVWGYDLTHQR